MPQPSSAHAHSPHALTHHTSTALRTGAGQKPEVHKARSLRPMRNAQPSGLPSAPEAVADGAGVPPPTLPEPSPRQAVVSPRRMPPTKPRRTSPAKTPTQTPAQTPAQTSAQTPALAPAKAMKEKARQMARAMLARQLTAEVECFLCLTPISRLSRVPPGPLWPSLAHAMTSLLDPPRSHSQVAFLQYAKPGELSPEGHEVTFPRHFRLHLPFQPHHCCALSCLAAFLPCPRPASPPLCLASCFSRGRAHSPTVMLTRIPWYIHRW